MHVLQCDMECAIVLQCGIMCVNCAVLQCASKCNYVCGVCSATVCSACAIFLQFVVHVLQCDMECAMVLQCGIMCINCAVLQYASECNYVCGVCSATVCSACAIVLQCATVCSACATV